MVVIKYFTTFLGMTNATFELVTNPKKMGKIISKDEAKKIIKANGLIVTYRDDNGIIWDSPSLDFYEEFKGIGKAIKEI